jgi:hypothetical protein
VAHRVRPVESVNKIGLANTPGLTARLLSDMPQNELRESTHCATVGGIEVGGAAAIEVPRKFTDAHFQTPPSGTRRRRRLPSRPAAPLRGSRT